MRLGEREEWIGHEILGVARREIARQRAKQFELLALSSDGAPRIWLASPPFLEERPIMQRCDSVLAVMIAAEFLGACQEQRGFAGDERMTAIKQAFHQEHGLQCGFCTPGMLITTWDLLKSRPDVDATAVRAAISGNLCRCTGYQGIVRSILRAARDMKDGKAVTGVP